MRLDNKRIRFEFPTEDDRRPPCVTDLKTGRAYELAAADAAFSMWRVELRDALGWCQLVDAAGTAPEWEEFVAPTPVRSPTEMGQARGFRLTWRAVPIPVDGGEVTCVVEGTLVDDSPLLQLTAHIHVNSERYAIWAFDFPYWPAVRPQGVPAKDWTLFAPIGFGEIVRDPVHAERLQEKPFREEHGEEPDGWRVYPACGTAMQYGAILAPGSVFYLATHDPAPERKKFFFVPNRPKESLHVRITHDPPLDGKGVRDYSVPYPIAIGVFPGGWHAAAETYRAWVSTTRWAQPRVQRRTPRWFEDVAIWWQHGYDYKVAGQDRAADWSRTKEAFPFPSAIHLYHWHQVPFDTLYPDYLPALPGVAELVKDCHAQGLRVMPYINGRICDPSSEVGLGAVPYTAKDAGRMLPVRQRTYRIEHWVSRQRLYAMCPATAYWQDAIADVCGRMVQTLDFDAIYLDQISCASALRCLDEHHGHPVGAGDYWVRGYEQMMAKVAAACARVRTDIAFTSECNAEPFDHILDGVLMWSCIAPDTVPAFPVVHNRYTIMFGYLYSEEDLKRKVPFAERLARGILWGNQLGWIGDGVRRLLLQPEHREMKEMLCDAAAVLGHMKNFFYDAELLPPEVIGYDSMNADSGYIPGLVRAIDGPIHATAWKLDENYAVVAANISAEPRQGTLRMTGPADSR